MDMTYVIWAIFAVVLLVTAAQSYQLMDLGTKLRALEGNTVQNAALPQPAGAPLPTQVGGC